MCCSKVRPARKFPGPISLRLTTACHSPLATFPEHRLGYLDWAIRYLETIHAREPSFGCMGLHEWAMVYRDPAMRHPQVPLRLSRAETDAVVESQPVRCTHFDAFRFFAPPRRPLNRWELTRAGHHRARSARLHPRDHGSLSLRLQDRSLLPIRLMFDAFELAIRSREVDMRASPYDLSAFGFSPVKIETAEGRAVYMELQRELTVLARPLRRRLIDLYRGLLAPRTQTPNRSVTLRVGVPSPTA